MEVNQIFELVNDALKQSIGEEEVLSQDLGNLTALGKAVFSNNLADKYVGSLMNKIAATKFVNRKYTGNIPSIMVEEYEFGSIINKIDVDLLEATENESWQLEKGTAIVPTFNPPKVNEKFYHLKDNTYEIDISIAENQVKQSFRNATELNSFISMIYNEIDKAFTAREENDAKELVATAIGMTAYKEAPSANYSAVSTNRLVNLRKLYNDEFGTNLTMTQAKKNPEFLKYAKFVINMYKDRLASLSTAFNQEGKARFTTAENLKCIWLSEFEKAINSYTTIQDTISNKDMLPTGDTLTCWQGSGKANAFDFASTSKIHVITPDAHEVELSGVVGIMFDRDCMAFVNKKRYASTEEIKKGRFYNIYNFEDHSQVLDLSENCVVFTIA